MERTGVQLIDFLELLGFNAAWPYIDILLVRRHFWGVCGVLAATVMRLGRDMITLRMCDKDMYRPEAASACTPYAAEISLYAAVFAEQQLIDDW